MKKVLKITALVLVVSLLTAGITVFAGGFRKAEIYPEGLTDEQKALVVSKFSACLDELVAEGEITAEQKNAIAEAIEKGGKSNKGRKNDKVDDERKMPEMTEEKKAEMLEKQKERLAKQLEKGEITQEQYDEYMEKTENGEFEPRGMGKGNPGGNIGKGEMPTEKPTVK